VREGGKHWGKNFKSNPEVVGYRCRKIAFEKQRDIKKKFSLNPYE
jgi:hypothetical protein